jgi:hypothetical protein
LQASVVTAGRPRTWNELPQLPIDIEAPSPLRDFPAARALPQAPAFIDKSKQFSAASQMPATEELDTEPAGLAKTTEMARHCPARLLLECRRSREQPGQIRRSPHLHEFGGALQILDGNKGKIPRELRVSCFRRAGRIAPCDPGTFPVRHRNLLVLSLERPFMDGAVPQSIASRGTLTLNGRKFRGGVTKVNVGGVEADPGYVVSNRA